MWTPEYFVREVALPKRIDGVVTPNDDGSFDIYLNANQPREKQLRWLEHELEHIRSDHFYREMDIAAAEREADGEKKGFAETGASDKRGQKPFFSSPEALIAWYREDTSRISKDYG